MAQMCVVSRRLQFHHHACLITSLCIHPSSLYTHHIFTVITTSLHPSSLHPPSLYTHHIPTHHLYTHHLYTHHLYTHHLSTPTISLHTSSLYTHRITLITSLYTPIIFTLLISTPAISTPTISLHSSPLHSSSLYSSSLHPPSLHSLHLHSHHVSTSSVFPTCSPHSCCLIPAACSHGNGCGCRQAPHRLAGHLLQTRLWRRRRRRRIGIRCIISSGVSLESVYLPLAASVSPVHRVTDHHGDSFNARPLSHLVGRDSQSYQSQ